MANVYNKYAEFYCNIADMKMGPPRPLFPHKVLLASETLASQVARMILRVHYCLAAFGLWVK